MKNIDKIRKQEPIEIACMLSAIIEECRVKKELGKCGLCKDRYCTVQGMIDYLDTDDMRDSVFVG